MIALDLLEAVCLEIEQVLKGFQYRSNDKNEPEARKQVQVYRQRIPLKSSRDHQSSMPYVCVSLEKGQHVDQLGGANRVQVGLMIVTWDDDMDALAYVDAFNILDKVYQWLFTKRVIAEQFFLMDDWEWVTRVDDKYGYFVIGALTTWEIGRMTEWSDDI